MNKSVWIGIATAIGLGEYARYGRMMDSISVKASNVKFSAQGTLMSISFSLEISNQEVLNNAVGKDFKNAEITIDTNTIVDFNLLSLLSVPIPIRDSTTINTSELFREFSSLVMNFKNLFNL